MMEPNLSGISDLSFGESVVAGKSTNKKEKKDFTVFFFQAAKWSLLAIVFCLCIMNIRPYVAFSGKLWATLISDPGLLPGFMAAINSTVSWLLGCFVWAALQLLQLLPTFVAHSRKTLNNLLEKSRQSDTFKIDEDDSEAVQWIKEKLNNLATLPVYQLRRLRLIAYAVDLSICLVVFTPRLFPPEWWDITMMVVTIWTVEAIVEGYFLLKGITEKVSPTVKEF